MAITLDELLGMNTNKTQNDRRVDSFPSYDDFSSRGRNTQPEQRQNTESGYSFDMRPAQAPRTTEYMRNYEMTRSYEAPRSSEYQSREYDLVDVARRRAAEPPQQSADREYGYSNYQSYANPSYQTAEKRSNLYEFTMRDNDRLSDAELEAKLSGGRVYSASARSMNAPARPTARVEEPVRERQSVFTPVKSEYKSESAKKARLNTKGKVLLAVYLAVIIIVAVLIIVNAGDLNSGTATTPSSSVSGVVADAPQTNILADYQIDFEYGAGYSIK